MLWRLWNKRSPLSFFEKNMSVAPLIVKVMHLLEKYSNLNKQGAIFIQDNRVSRKLSRTFFQYIVGIKSKIQIKIQFLKVSDLKLLIFQRIIMTTVQSYLVIGSKISNYW